MDSLDEKAISLGNQAADYIASATKALAGAVPFAGSLLAELAGMIIPNQRMDRLVKFAKELETQIGMLDQDFVYAKLKDENFTDLTEEAMRHAARSVSDERRKYLATLLANGIKSEDVNFIESKHLLRILGEINDIEVIWLTSYLRSPAYGLTDEFYEKHAGTLARIIPRTNADFDKVALQDSYKAHLARLNLLSQQVEFDAQTQQPEFDQFSHTFKMRDYDITPLGLLLLRHIGIANELR